jgi:phage repressor protein C with HTH and peptisase S24 domain
MKSIDEIRRENIALLEKEYGSLTALADALGKSDSQVSQWKKGSTNSGTGKQRGMNATSARYIEQSTGKPTGWMDTSHNNYGTAPAQQIQTIQENISQYKTNVDIPQYIDASGSMGNGVLLRDQPGEIQNWSVSPDWIYKNVKNCTSTSNLCIVTGFGDSMRGMFNSGDPMLVDKGVKTVDFDGVYFFRVGNEGFIKTLQRIPGQGMRAISANDSYETWTITPDMDFEVFARVIKVWKSADF